MPIECCGKRTNPVALLYVSLMLIRDALVTHCWGLVGCCFGAGLQVTGTDAGVLSVCRVFLFVVFYSSRVLSVRAAIFPVPGLAAAPSQFVTLRFVLLPAWRRKQTCVFSALFEGRS